MQLDKYHKAFIEGLDISPDTSMIGLKFNEIEEWDSIGHMSLMSALEDAFDISLDNWLSLDNQFLLSVGYSNSTSKREHPQDMNVLNIDLSCNIFDLGLEFEIFNNLSILSSYKRLFSEGLEYLPIRNNDFTIESYNAFQCDLVHEINSFGIGYDFNEKSSVLLNYQILNFSDKLLDNSFSINQFFVLVQIQF